MIVRQVHVATPLTGVTSKFQLIVHPLCLDTGRLSGIIPTGTIMYIMQSEGAPLTEIYNSILADV
jgi:hypothetical protein